MIQPITADFRQFHFAGSIVSFLARKGIPARQFFRMAVLRREPIPATDELFPPFRRNPS
jgi:hypothetical protein